MNVYFTGCWHVSHEGILSLTKRGEQFSTIRAHDLYLIDRINETVKEDDILFVLGDIGKKVSMPEFLDSLRVRDIRLTPGNHCVSDYSMQYLRHTFKVVEMSLEHRYKDADGKTNRIFLSHYPHLCFNKSFVGAINLFSHVHSHLNLYQRIFMPHARILDVGLDSAKEYLGDYKPFSLADVLNLVESRRGWSPDANKAIVTSAVQIPAETGINWRITYEYDFNWEHIGREIWTEDEYYEVRQMDSSSMILNGLKEPKVGEYFIWQ